MSILNINFFYVYVLTHDNNGLPQLTERKPGPLTCVLCCVCVVWCGVVVHL